MISESMLDKLDRYYQSQGISALGFNCKHREACSSDCKGQMVSVPESYVGAEYEAGTLPRLLFVSSDTNDVKWLKDHPEYGTLREIRKLMWDNKNKPLKHQGHWHKTLELAQALLAPYAKERLGKVIEFNDFVGYIANVRSTRCKDISIGTREGDPRMFLNCIGFLKGEIEALCPDIIVTQGTRAKKALWNTFPVTRRVPMPGNPHHGAFYEIVQLAENHTAIKIVAWHPCARGWRSGEKQQFMDWAAKSVRGVIPVA